MTRASRALVALLVGLAGCAALSGPYQEYEIRFDGGAPPALGQSPSDEELVNSVAWLIRHKLELPFPAAIKAYVYVILPLSFRISLPALNNNLVNLVKTTTIAYAIAVPEMLYVANQIWSDESNVPEIMNVLLITYVALVGMLVFVMGRWERALRVPGYAPA